MWNKNIKRKQKRLVLWALIFIPYLLLIPASAWYFRKVDHIENASFIVINKADLNLYLYNYKGELLQRSKIAVGKKPGNKLNKGDLKTPEGVFNITEIADASNWSHDFKDDTLGIINGAYGPYFIRLHVPGQNGIGIHGTHDNNSLGTRASEGCIRMNNSELESLIKHIQLASVVIITPGTDDIKENSVPVSKKKDRKKTVLKKKLKSKNTIK
jgi:lipoprotein-anchoring transpeptidase ErfK/SrfK